MGQDTSAGNSGLPVVHTTDLHGRVALVTGSSRGIGRGCALAMAAAGADIVVNYYSYGSAERQEADAADARETVRLVEAFGRRAIVAPGNAADHADVERVVAAAVSELGKLDITVANAYRSIRKPFLELQPEDWDTTVGVTLGGVFHTCQVAAQQMVRQGHGGKLVAISSVLAERALSTSAPYNAAKAGINQLIRTMANELARHQINVNAIEPGWIDTPGERQYSTEDELREAGAKLPWGRLGRPEEIGAVAAFLASDAASYMSGSIVKVDGAYMAAVGEF